MSPETPSRTAVAADLSLADVLAALQDATLPARRRQEMRSALRTIARVLDKPLERIPANPRLRAAIVRSRSECLRDLSSPVEQHPLAGVCRTWFGAADVSGAAAQRAVACLEQTFRAARVTRPDDIALSLPPVLLGARHRSR